MRTEPKLDGWRVRPVERSVDAWHRACERAQARADQRRIQEVNSRDLRRRAHAFSAMIVVLMLVILFLPR